VAIEDIDKMTAPLSDKGETQVASGPDPNDMSGWYEMYDDLKGKGELPDWMDSFELFMENLDVLDISPMDFTKRKEPQGIMQLASASSGDDIIQSAIIWAAGLPQFGSIDAVVKSLEDGSTDMNGLVNAYMDARVDSN